MTEKQTPKKAAEKPAEPLENPLCPVCGGFLDEAHKHSQPADKDDK